MLCSEHFVSHQCWGSLISKLGTLEVPSLAPKLPPEDSSSVMGLMNSWVTSFQSTIGLGEKNVIRNRTRHSKIVFADCQE